MLPSIQVEMARVLCPSASRQFLSRIRSHWGHESRTLPEPRRQDLTRSIKMPNSGLVHQDAITLYLMKTETSRPLG